MIKIVIALCFFAIGHSLEARKLNPRVCVIGAGVGGLSAARHLKREGVNFVVLESTSYVGGTWRYDERVGNDEYGLPIHTSMYKHLRTNLPKVTMELPNFPLPEDVPSFLTWKQFYDYLNSYAKHFDLEKYIKLLHQVTSVKRVGEVWKVKYEHIPTGKEFEDSFDYVIVATGHHSKPQMPNFPGEELFKGTIIHSHDYREPDPYKCRRVLIIGSGPSGMDIGLDVANVSKTLIHSHHSRVNFQTPFPPNYVKKPDVKEFNENGAIFVDGTFEELDDIIYCTGFQYSYPFLDESSGLTISPRSVTPLHKLVLNINQPTMLVFGAVTRSCLIISLDAQARYASALIKGYFEPPSREEMMEELQRRYDALRAKGRPLYYVHMLAEKEDQYYAEISRESGIERVPPVISKIHAADAEAIFKNLYTFRNYEYTVIDDETYSRVLLDIEVPHMSVNCSATL